MPCEKNPSNEVASISIGYEKVASQVHGVPMIRVSFAARGPNKRPENPQDPVSI
jgi:hypothetical protein